MSDEDILEAAARAVAEHGPLRMTLQHVADRLGVTPAAVLRRFGTKRDLLLAVSRASSADVEAAFERARREHASPLEALVEGLAAQTRSFATPQEVANGLAFLQLDLTDAAFQREADRFFRRFRGAIERLLREARADGELDTRDAPRLARSVEVAFHGSLITWAVRREGPVDDAVRADVRAVLAPYVTPRAARASEGRRPSRAPNARGPPSRPSTR